MASVAKVSRCGHAPGGGNDSSGPRATSTTITASERTRTTASHRDADRSSVLLGRETDQTAANARVSALDRLVADANSMRAPSRPMVAEPAPFDGVLEHCLRLCG